MATATTDDVKEVITTNLSNGDITDSINYASELNTEYNSESNQTSTQTKNIERWGAIVNIRLNKERGVAEDAVGDASAVYEGDELANARSQLRQWVKRAGGDTAMVDAFGGVSRDSGRHITTT